jgi:uncharacterized lipoprotein YmbA
MRSLLALTALLLVDWLAGCGFMTSRPQIHRYQLGPFTAARLKSDRVPIKLGSVTGTAPFRDTGIAYQTAAYRLDTYGFSRWIAPPVELLAQRLNHLVEQPSKGEYGSSDALVLDATVISFQEVDSSNENSGLVEIDFCLRRISPPFLTKWCQTFRSQTAASGNTREAAVAAISKSLDDILHDLVAALDIQLQPPSVGQVDSRL